MSNTLQIDPQKAKDAYAKADTKGKKLLEGIFGKSAFEKKITERVASFEDACTILRFDPIKTLPYPEDTVDSDEIALNAIKKLTIIARALNEGWEPNWKDSNEYKWFPYFQFNKTGFGFSGTDFVFTDTGSDVGSRLCFKSSELAEYAGRKFEKLYNDFLLIK